MAFQIQPARGYACQDSSKVSLHQQNEKGYTRAQNNECYMKPANSLWYGAGPLSYVPLVGRTVSTVQDRLLRNEKEALDGLKKLEKYFSGGDAGQRKIILDAVAEQLKGENGANVLRRASAQILMTKALGVKQADLDALKDGDDKLSFKKIESLDSAAYDRVLSAMLVLVLDMGLGAHKGEQLLAKKIFTKLPTDVRAYLTDANDQTDGVRAHGFLASFIGQEGYQEALIQELRKLTSTGFGNMLKENDEETVKVRVKDKKKKIKQSKAMMSDLAELLAQFRMEQLKQSYPELVEKAKEHLDRQDYSVALTELGFTASSQAVLLRTAANMSELAGDEGEIPHHNVEESKSHNPLLEHLTASAASHRGGYRDYAPGRGKLLSHLHRPQTNEESDGELDVARAKAMLAQCYTAGHGRVFDVPAVVKGLLRTNGQKISESRLTLMNDLVRKKLVQVKHGKYVVHEDLERSSLEHPKKALGKLLEAITLQDHIASLARALSSAELHTEIDLLKASDEQEATDLERKLGNIQVAYRVLLRSVSPEVYSKIHTEVEAKYPEVRKAALKKVRKEQAGAVQGTESESEDEADTDTKAKSGKKRKASKSKASKSKAGKSKSSDAKDSGSGSSSDSEEESETRKPSRSAKAGSKRARDDDSDSDEVDSGASDDETSPPSKRAKKASSKKTSSKKAAVTDSTPRKAGSKKPKRLKRGVRPIIEPRRALRGSKSTPSKRGKGGAKRTTEVTQPVGKRTRSHSK